MAHMRSKATIPKALREQVWRKHFGQVYRHRCSTRWCTNHVTVFDFQVGHDTPESKGGTLALTNLVPLCSRCNSSMGDTYSFQEWSRLSTTSTTSWWTRLTACVLPTTRITTATTAGRRLV